VPLVLLTPIGLDAEAWQFCQLPESLKHEFPGFGRRRHAPRATTMAALADEVAERYRGDLDLVGVSMGGMVAQHVCLRHPTHVRSLLIACTGAHADPDAMVSRAHAVESRGMTSVLSETLERWFTSTALRRRPIHPGVQYAKETLTQLDPRRFGDGWRAIATHDARDRLPDFLVPTTVLSGRHDLAAPPARCAELARLVPNSRLVTLDGPHMLLLERPVEFTAAVRDHLSRVSSSGAVEGSRR